MAGRGTDIILGGNWQAQVENLNELSDEQKAAMQADWQAKNEAVKQAGAPYHWL